MGYVMMSSLGSAKCGPDIFHAHSFLGFSAGDKYNTCPQLGAKLMQQGYFFLHQ